MEQGGCKQSGKVKNHLVRGGVPDAPYVALRDGCGWLLKRASTDVGEGVLTLPLAVRREMAVRMDGLYSQRFRKPPRKGGRGRPPLQLDWDGCEIYAAERIVTHDMLARWVSLYLRYPPSSAMAHRGRCTLQGWVRDGRFSNHRPPCAHKTPGGEKGKKDNRLTPQPPSAAAPLCKGSDGGLLPFYLFTTGSVFGHPP